jgi:hypothetical protein
MATTLQCGCVYTVGDFLPTEFCKFHKPFLPQPDPMPDKRLIATPFRPDPKDAEIARLQEENRVLNERIDELRDGIARALDGLCEVCKPSPQNPKGQQ